MGWDITVPAPVVPAPVVYSEVSADSAAFIATANGKISDVLVKLSAAVPATKKLTVTLKVNGTAVAAFDILPAASTNVSTLVAGNKVVKGDVVSLSLIGDHASVAGTATLTIGFAAQS